MSQPDPKQQQQRTAILALVAVVLIALLGLDRLLPDEATAPMESSHGGAAKTTQAAPLQGAPKAGVKELLARYEPLLDSGPFTVRSFRPRPKALPPRPRRPNEPRRPDSKPAGPQPIKVRWTGVIGEGEGASAVLEERSTGRGLFASKGLKLGEIAFVAVKPDSLVLETGGRKRQLALGDAIDLPPSAKDQLTKLGPPAPEPGTVRSGGGYKPAVKLTKDRRQAILERLRARRLASLNKKKAEAAKASANKTEPKKEGK